MRPDRSPGAWSGSEFLGWCVDAVNGWAIAGFERAAPEPPLCRLSEGAEHGVSSELLTGDPSGRPCPVR
jgi:hypothetical protein